MQSIRNLLEAAGFGDRRAEMIAFLLGSSSLFGALTYLTLGLVGLAMCFMVLTLVICLEVLRGIAASRQKRLDQLWPTVFDALRTGAQAGLLLDEQVEYLATEGPELLREDFALLHAELEMGLDTEEALGNFQARIGSRSGDYPAIVMALVQEVGGRGEAQNWQRSGAELRSEQALLAQVRAKQGWVLGSAKIALLAPWLICLLLLNLEQNRSAFESAQGSLVLILGLCISLFAYFLTNFLGRFRMPERVFYVG